MSQFNASQLAALLGHPQPLNAALEFKAGLCRESNENGKITVTPDSRKGVVRVVNQDDVLHCTWSLRSNSVLPVTPELDIVLLDCTIERYSECKDGYVLVLKFASGQRHWFWVQEPINQTTETSDQSIEARFKKLINQPDTPAQAPITPARPAQPTQPATQSAAQPAAQSSSQPAAQPAAPAAAGGANADAIARVLAAMQSAVQSSAQQQSINQPRYHLADVLDADRILALLDDETKAQLASQLPPNDGDVSSNMRSAQFLQTVNRMNGLLYSPNYGSLMSSLGLDVKGFGVEGLCEALMQRAQQQQQQGQQVPSTPNQPTQPHNKEPERK